MSSSAIDYDLITFGETMWRLSPPGKERLETAHSLAVHVAGAESNLAVALARLGKRTAWWSRLPDSPLGRHVANTLRVHGVDTSYVRWSAGRLGTYFVEFGSPPRPSQIIYDRANSAASAMTPEDFEWPILRRARWLHVTGITPALSESCRATTLRAVAEATAAGIQISFDLNYRAKLWSVEEARPVCDEIAAAAAVVMMAERDALAFYGSDDPAEVYRRWNGPTVVMTRGARGASAFNGSVEVSATGFSIEIVDRIGAGDAFDAGLLCALMEGKALEEALRWGNACAALKLTIPGDIALVTRAELEHVLAFGSAGVLR